MRAPIAVLLDVQTYFSAQSPATFNLFKLWRLFATFFPMRVTHMNLLLFLFLCNIPLRSPTHFIPNKKTEK